MKATALADLDPDAIAADAVRRLREHLHHVAFQLAPGLTLRLDGDDGCADLGATVRALVLYAQRGCSEAAPVWDWTDSGMASDGLLSVLSALYSRAADHGLEHTAIDATDVLDDEEIADDLTLVLVAAAARIRLDQRGPVSARELAALAGLTVRRVRQLVAAGEIRATDDHPARVRARDAVRWLAARAVPGFGG